MKCGVGEREKYPYKSNTIRTIQNKNNHYITVYVIFNLTIFTMLESIFLQYVEDKQLINFTQKTKSVFDVIGSLFIVLV